MEFLGTVGKASKSEEISCNTSRQKSEQAPLGFERYLSDFPPNLSGIMAQTPQENGQDRA
jgi:hypothetical protein